MSGADQPVPREPEFDLVVEPCDGGVVVRASGDLDLATAGSFRDAVREHLAAGPVVLDLARLKFMDSSGIRALDALARDAEREGWSFTMRRDLPPPIRQVLELTGMDETLPFEAAR